MTIANARLLSIIAMLLLLIAAVPSIDAAKERPASERVERDDRLPSRSSETVVEKTVASPKTTGEAQLHEPAVPVPSVPNEPSMFSPEAGETINWYCVASGGGITSSPNYSIVGTIGQAAVGSSSTTSTTALHGFWQSFESAVVHCCADASVGDVNCSSVIDITDLQVMIDHLFLTLSLLCCAEEGNVNYPGSGLEGESDITDIVDLQLMIDSQFLTLEPMPPCP
ncbi:MAG: hypothetical protein GY867_08130 [bacterium]|nr:hypothetical protein [bacterium]